MSDLDVKDETVTKQVTVEVKEDIVKDMKRRAIDLNITIAKVWEMAAERFLASPVNG